MYYPRECIFTGLPARTRLVLTEDNHSWTKAVPCCKAYLISRESPKYRERLLKFENGLIKKFYENEVHKALGESGIIGLVWTNECQRLIREILASELAYYEGMREDVFIDKLEATLAERLNKV